MNKHVSNVSNIAVIKRTLWGILLCSVAMELFFFPEKSNMVGCLVSVLSTTLFFKYVFRIEIIRRFPICFIVFLQLFAFMYLPLPTTLADGMPMSHDLYNPTLSFILQFVYFCVTLLSFKMACRLFGRHKGLQRLLFRYGFFTSPTTVQLWALGGIGWIFRLFMMNSQGSNEALGSGGTLNVFSLFVYAPILILFKPLMRGDGSKDCSVKQRIAIYLYIACCVIMMIATNSRSKMISPVIVLLSCYLISAIYNRSNKVWLTPKKIIIGVVAFFVITGPATDMAFAMVVVRAERKSLNFQELLSRTIEVYKDKKTLQYMRELNEDKSESKGTNDWNEKYVSNLFLDRFCNYRVIDASIYHAQRAGIPNERMQEDFVKRCQIMYPQPIVNLLFGYIDKSQYAYSSMDKLYAESMLSGIVFASYIVGGDVGLGLSVFGGLYFIVQFIVYTLLFGLFVNLVYWRGNMPVFSVLVLLNIYFTYFMHLKVANGISSHIIFLAWGFFYTTFFQLLVYRIIINITSLFKRR